MVVRNDGIPLGIGGFCFYCGRAVVRAKIHQGVRHPPETYTEDHVVPKSKGGRKTVTACFGCNQDKRDLTLDEFRLVRAFRAGLVPMPEYKFAAEQGV